MKTYKLLPIVVASTLVLVAFQPTPTPDSVHQETHTFTWGDDTTSVPSSPLTLSIPQFDTQGGTRTLRAVRVELETQQIWYGGYETLGTGSASGTFAMNFEPEVGHIWPTAQEWGTEGDNWCRAIAKINTTVMATAKAIPPIEESTTFSEPYDGTRDYAGTSGALVKQDQIEDGVLGPQQTAGALLNYVTGTDDCDLVIYFENEIVAPYTLWTSGWAYTNIIGGEDYLVSGSVIYTWQ